jgi:PAS domain S-box-containing protein
MEDVTERTHWLQRLEASEHRYRRLFESARDGILILDAATMRIIDSNPFMHELLGYSHDELLGKELWQIGLFSDREQSRTVQQRLKSERYVRYDNLPLRSAAGSIREVEFVSNVYGENGLQLAQCNIRDISLRREIERILETQARDLAASHRQKDEFLAILSHELRNPLAPIFSALQVLAEEANGSPAENDARGVIERQVTHLARLIDDLLEVSRVTTGRVRLQVERVDLNATVARLVEATRPAMERKKQHLSVSMPADELAVVADPVRLEQIFSNLLTNACKYTDDGGRVSVGLEREGENAVVRVQDNGVGIAPALLEKVFDLFIQAERSLSRSEGGLGVGLALAKSLVELHGGTVEAHSAGLGLGSEFVVRLPLAPGPQPVATAPDRPAAGQAVGALRVLIADDNSDAASMLGILLRRRGHHVEVAHDGRRALEMALASPPEVMLLDIGLPGLSGLEVARQLRERPEMEDIVLVAVTGYGREADRQRSMDAGFDHHLVKPVATGTLTALLTEIAAIRRPG